MKTIIAGGRNYHLTAANLGSLTSLFQRGVITSVVHGGATGVDKDAGRWADSLGIPFMVFVADWGRHGKAAGPIRNHRMVNHVGYSGVLVVFPGGKGTDNILRIAQDAGLIIYDFKTPDIFTEVVEWTGLHPRGVNYAVCFRLSCP